MATFRRLLTEVTRGFPYPGLHAKTALERLRRLNFQEGCGHLSPLARTAVFMARVLGWPLVVVPGIVSAMRHLPNYGVPVRPLECFPMYGAALLHNIPPVEYLLFGFADPVRRRDSGQYLYWMDQPALQWLNRRRGADNAQVQDKGRFAAQCRAAGLPHAEVLLEFRAGREIDGRDAPPREDLWSKPLTGSGGAGCRLWRAQTDGTWLSGEDRRSEPQWIDHLRKNDGIVQRVLHNHSGLTGMTSGPAVVLRLVTVLDRGGLAELIGASLALPQGRAESTAGALGCIPDLETGTIREVSVANSGPSTVHPDTGVPLVGRVVPLWRECRDLVLRAHRDAFPAFASLGWDVVVTPEGPVLLETNSGWGTLGQQMHFGPLGRGPLGRIVAEELERAA